MAWTPYAVPLVVSVALCGLLALYAFRRRETAGGRAFATLMLALGIWSLFYALEVAATGLAAKVWFAKVSYLGIVATPLAWFATTVQHTGRRTWLTRRAVALLALEPLATLAFVFTNELHGLIWSRVALDAGGPFLALDVDHGAWFWVHVAGAYLLVLAGSATLVLAAVQSRQRQLPQLAALLVAIVAPWLANVLYILRLTPVPHLDLTPFAFTLSAVSLGWIAFRFGFSDVLLGLVPTARLAIVAGMRDGVLVLNEHAVVVDVNPAAEAMVGRPAAALLGRPAAGVLPGWPPAGSGKAGAIQSELTLGEGEQRRHYDLLVSALKPSDPESGGTLLVLRDITERKRAEDALRAQEAQLRLALEAASMCAWEWNVQTGDVTCSEKVADLFGVRADELRTAEAFQALFHPDDRAAVVQAGERAVALGEDFAQEYRIVWPDGSVRWIAGRARPVRDAGGATTSLVGIGMDVTERKRAEAAVLGINRRLRDALSEVAEREDTARRHAERLKLLNDFARTVSSTLDLQSVFALVVQQLSGLVDSRRSGISRYESARGVFRVVAHTAEGAPYTGVAKTVDAVVPAADSAPGLVLHSGTAYVAQDTGEAALVSLRQLSGDGIRSFASLPIMIGESFWGTLDVGFDAPNALTSERLGFLGAVASHLGVAIKNAELYADLGAALRELKATQDQVVQQERLRALGQMASGIAHDFNNALAPVVGFAELLLLRPENLQDQEKVLTYLQLIHTGAQDATRVVSRLREFYRRRDETESPVPVDVHELVEQTIALTQPKWKDQAQAGGRTVRVERDLRPVPMVMGNAAELREALTNLIFNAVDAMGEDGVLTVGVRHAANPGRIVLEVSDNGHGMTEEVRQRCLEPFFSTKGERGTGLGLAMVHGIAQRHGGVVEVESLPALGSTVRLVLPVGVPNLAGEPLAPEAPVRPRRVLVVDDEPAVREVTAAYLANDGHTVATAATGREALALFQQQGFDIVLTDRAMPEMGGDQLAAALKRLAPGVPVILLTGFGDLMAAAGERPDGVDSVLGKPIALPKLRRVLADFAA